MVMSSELTELRAERLRVAVHALNLIEADPVMLLKGGDVGLFRTGSVEDRMLAESCLEAERDLRRREWEAVEVLIAATPPGGMVEDVCELPADRALPALRAAQVCGWLRKAPFDPWAGE
jgi:hypothetical protein